jgi:hypothetical protein
MWLIALKERTMAGINPIRFIDPDGMASESIHLDQKGNVLRNYDDGHNTVFIHKAGTTATDVDKNYVETARKSGYTDESAGGTKIGELGGQIDVTTIVANILKDNKATAMGMHFMSEAQWVGKVLPNQEWDYKANNNTIFGVAWSFDIKAREQGLNLSSTGFFDKNSKLYFEDAAAFGNYNAGYTGIYAGVPESHQLVWAGLGEVAKFHPDTIKRVHEIVNGYETHGDNEVDYMWNTMGMSHAKSGK